MKKFITIFVLINLLVFTIPALASTSQYTGYPTFTISSVVRDDTVKIVGTNFPANDTFTVTMGVMGTAGIGGWVVTTTDSGSGGSLVKTYNIPDALKGSYRLAIRLQSSTSGYYAYNWFYNNTANANVSTPKPKPPVSSYTGYPTFLISSVSRDNTVTIVGTNFPANDTFTVTMGVYGSRGIGGWVVTTTDSGSGGSLTKTYSIPDTLKGSYRIAIRLQSPTSGYYAYNWFYNNNAP
jgi:hypothetical protein